MSSGRFKIRLAFALKSYFACLTDRDWSSDFVSPAPLIGVLFSKDLRALKE